MFPFLLTKPEIYSGIEEVMLQRVSGGVLSFFLKICQKMFSIPIVGAGFALSFQMLSVQVGLSCTLFFPNAIIL